MQTRDVVAFCGLPLVLLAAACLVQDFHLWSYLANITLPWLCSAVAVSLLLLGVTCAAMQCAPSEIPIPVSVIVVAGALVAFGAGMVVDLLSYAADGSGKDWIGALPSDWMSSIGEWLGFGLILSALFWLPRMSSRVPT